MIKLQPSTKRGIALIVAGVAAATGHTDLFTAHISDAGVDVGGVVGTLVPVVIGLWEALRNEFK